MVLRSVEGVLVRNSFGLFEVAAGRKKGRAVLEVSFVYKDTCCVEGGSEQPESRG